jgi:cobalt-zinc-cadmium efflux system membrane fusion protein
MAATILLVDDDEILSQVLRRVLTREGHTVIEAANVAQALQLAREHPLSLGLLDLCLPDGDGVELARRLEAESKQFPLILITAYPLRLRDHPELAERFSRVLTKPLNLDELRQAIETTLRNPTPDADLKAKLANLANAPELAERDLTLHTPPMPEPLPPAPLSVATVEAPREPFAPPAPPPAAAAAKPRKGLLVAGIAVAAVVLLFVVLPALGVPGLPSLFHEEKPKPTVVEQPLRPKLVELTLPAETVEQMGVKTAVIGRHAERYPLHMAGTLTFDPNRLDRIQARFGGEVVKIGTILARKPDGISDERESRELRLGDRVKAGTLLAEVWSKDLGEKKAELVDTLVSLDRDQTYLNTLKQLERENVVPPITVFQQQTVVSGELNTLAKVRRTLQIWKIPPQEIREIEEEARRIIKLRGKEETEKEKEEREQRVKDWARVEVKAHINGVIVERNILAGNIIDPTLDLFKVAGLSKMAVYAHAYEEDLLRLEKMPRPIPWQIRLTDPGAPLLTSRGAEQIGFVFDQNQHTDLVMGLVDNPVKDADSIQPRYLLRAGQYVTATVQIDAPSDVVSVPIGALIEDGSENAVFLQPDPGQTTYLLRRVAIVKRFEKMAYVKSRLTPAEAKRGLQPITPGERVVTRAAGLLKSALDDAQSKVK